MLEQVSGVVVAITTHANVGFIGRRADVASASDRLGQCDLLPVRGGSLRTSGAHAYIAYGPLAHPIRVKSDKADID